MEIKYFKVPVTITRQGMDCLLEIHEDQKTIHKTEPIEVGSSQIVNLAKELDDYNNKQKQLAKHTLLASEDKQESHIIIKMLT